MINSIKSETIIKFNGNEPLERADLVVVEEPLEIRLGYGAANDRQQKSISVTMRTPTGHDFELVMGYLFTEGIISRFNQILSIHYCTDNQQQKQENIVRVELHPAVQLDFQKSERYSYTSSSCGICGKASIEAIRVQCPAPVDSPLKISCGLIYQLPNIVKEKQVFFKHTGGSHVAALIGLDTPFKGNLLLVREDIGRHNALDKVIGAALQQNFLPLADTLLFMSSRASFELIQKAVMAGISLMVCVGAPSSLAIETAQTFGMTLIGFTKEHSFNIYSGSSKVIS
ncbi:formate dehydrogenase accessory sulfurtransferase FdhD [Emticicia sp. BO119]|uniref:formate dehydrogenase accessory sulfurtransferase FdhD n=1 Tax=Emticicia sp. BO119 TaxID=2757768 RepID=UPI0015F07886|nr:formate dehydrogenase accessory sulfurtransferase FdhD [Emticicia sp. BO119]MBA4853029.1 formate dehydrogenase accessory sulfurtransferase FdhD [Emticicia sp. BO119]